MDSSAPIEIASTIQSASIRHHPDPDYDINPSTSASKVEPVDLSSSTVPAAEDEVPLSALRLHPRRKTLPPLPDLRFEQSYLKSIEGALSWQGVAWITVRDQVLLPLFQGTLWTLAIAGWRHWNRATHFQGASVGARIRRWWWGVNKWQIPEQKPAPRMQTRRMAAEATDFFTSQFSSAGID